MKTYTVTLSNDWKKLFQCFVDADTEQEAYLKARELAKEQGKTIPDEVWVRFKEHKLKHKL